MTHSPIDARDEVLHRFTNACEADARIRAAFLGGSNATGTADAWSDLDLYVVLADDGYDAFLADRNDFMARLGTTVFREDFNGFGFDMVVFILDDGVAGELMFHRASGVADIQSGPFLPLIDRDGRLRDTSLPNRMPTGEETAAELYLAVTWFWKDLLHLIRSIARNRLWTAFLFLEKLRGGCAYLVALAQDPPPAPSDHFVPPGGYDQLDHLGETPEIVLLRSTFGPLERASLLASARTLVEVYQRLGPTVAARYDVPYPSRAAEVVLALLDAVERDATGGASVR